MKQTMGYVTTTKLIVENKDEYFIAEHPAFDGKCICHGDTHEQAVKGLSKVLKKVKSIYTENNWDLPSKDTHRIKLVPGKAFDARLLQK